MGNIFKKISSSLKGELEDFNDNQLQKNDSLAQNQKKNRAEVAAASKNNEANKNSKNSLKAKSKDSKDEAWLEQAEGQLTVDVFQTESDIVIKSTIAGVNPETLDIAIANDMITIRGARETDEKVKPEEYYYQELYWGPFSRSIILPTEIDPENADAQMKNGILTIKLPKINKEKTRKLKVKIA